MQLYLKVLLQITFGRLGTAVSACSAIYSCQLTFVYARLMKLNHCSKCAG